jgi:hypothetical protein
MQTAKVSPALLDRFERLAGCRGAWILDLRGSDNRGYDLHHVPGYVYGVGNLTPAEALEHCAANRWRGCRLLFSAEALDDDCSWPGGYDAPSHYRSNARVFREEFADALELADGDADGTALDLRYVTPEMIETIEALESYPILDENDHSQLELDCQQEAWECWAASDWRDAIRDKLAEFAPESADFPEYWADDQLDAIPDDKLEPQLLELFRACAEMANEYWQEESGGSWWIDLKRVAAGVDRLDLVGLTGLALLDPDQEWRREPYPWPDGSRDPLVPALA